MDLLQISNRIEGNVRFAKPPIGHGPTNGCKVNGVGRQIELKEMIARLKVRSPDEIESSTSPSPGKVSDAFVDPEKWGGVGSSHA